METGEIRIVFFRLQDHSLPIFQQLHGNHTSVSVILLEASILHLQFQHGRNQNAFVGDLGAVGLVGGVVDAVHHHKVNRVRSSDVYK